MGWRRRLFELVAAGGALTACNDAPTGPSFCGNALPDPCICDRTPLDAGQCVAEAACRAALGTWIFGPPPQYPDATPGLNGYCQPRDPPPPPPQVDAGADAPPVTDAPHD